VIGDVVEESIFKEKEKQPATSHPILFLFISPFFFELAIGQPPSCR
jgi:hypothetical protein